jgi:hypothetical protein
LKFDPKIGRRLLKSKKISKKLESPEIDSKSQCILAEVGCKSALPSPANHDSVGRYLKILRTTAPPTT